LNSTRPVSRRKLGGNLVAAGCSWNGSLAVAGRLLGSFWPVSWQQLKETAVAGDLDGNWALLGATWR